MKTKRVGELLQEERERRHLSVAQVAAYTHIKPEFIESLENNSFSGLPPAPFVKGFVRTLCVTLGLQPDNMIALLRRDFKEVESGHLLPSDAWKKKPHRLFGGVVGWLSLLIGVVVIVAISYTGIQWFVAQQPPYLEVIEPKPFSDQSSQILVTGTTDPDAVVAVNGQIASLRPDGSFSQEVDLPSGGLITIQVEATDAKGKSSSLEIPVRVTAQ